MQGEIARKPRAAEGVSPERVNLSGKRTCIGRNSGELRVTPGEALRTPKGKLGL